MILGPTFGTSHSTPPKKCTCISWTVLIHIAYSHGYGSVQVELGIKSSSGWHYMTE